MTRSLRERAGATTDNAAVRMPLFRRATDLNALHTYDYAGKKTLWLSATELQTQIPSVCDVAAGSLEKWPAV